MKKILVPTDFSKTAHDAYLYARSLAEKLNASLEVVHAYTGTFNTNEPLILEPLKGREEVLLDRLKAFCGELPPQDEMVKTKVLVDCKAVQTLNIANKLIKLSAEADLIVMGASGEHDVLEKIFGSVSSKVAQKAHCPVLLIPRGVTYKSPEKLLYASNWESVQAGFIEKVIEFGGHFGSGIDFVHVCEEYGQEAFKKLEEEIFAILFKEKIPTFPFNLLETKGQSPLAGLNKYAAEQTTDIIILVNRQDGLLENILGKSMTKEMAINAQFPILVYHM